MTGVSREFQVWGMHDACRNACVFGGRFLDVHTHKAECGGMALTFPKTEQILKILMVLPGHLLLALRPTA